MKCDYCEDHVETVFHGERQLTYGTKPVQLCARCLVMEAGLWVDSKVRVS